MVSCVKYSRGADGNDCYTGGQDTRSRRNAGVGWPRYAHAALRGRVDDLTVLNLALPHISADLRPSGSELLWIVDIYGFPRAARACFDPTLEPL
jgi:hypothetical protein